MTREMNINKGESAVGNFISGIHSVSYDTAVHAPGLVWGQPVDTGSAVTLVHQQISDKTQRNSKLSLVGEPVVSANGQPLEIKGKCDLHICVNGV